MKFTNLIPEQIWKDRYCKNNELLSDNLRRVAKYCSQNQEEETSFFNLMDNGYFLPAGRTMSNAGIGKSLTLNNCFTLNFVEDSMEDIFEMVKMAALTHQKGGGTGFEFSKLRPKGTPTSNDAIASGVVSFMDVFNAQTATVNQGSRRGANMAVLSIYHPDIKDYINAKSYDQGKLVYFNVSVMVDDKFMNAVKNDENIYLHYPVYTDEGFYITDENLWTHKQEIGARELWNTIIQKAYDNGEPGILFYENMNKDNNTWYIETIINTNPCLHKNTYMVTENGLEKISQLKSRIWNGNEYTESKSWKTGIKKVYRIMTSNGYEYTTTEDHKFLLKDDTWSDAISLIGKDIKFEIKEKEWMGIKSKHNINYEILGFEFGDGSYHKASKRMKYIYASPIKDKEVIEIIEKEFKSKFIPRNPEKLDIDYQIIIPYGTIYANAFYSKIENRMIPDWILQLPKEDMRSFVRGLFSANGCNLKDYHKIQLVSINAEMLKQVQQMLLLFGIKAKLWYHNKSKSIEFSNGEYICKKSSHLVISRDSYKRYLDNIGFMQTYKNGYLDYKNKLDEDFEKVILISELDDEEVWDFTEPNLHLGITNGAYVHNCGEYKSGILYNTCDPKQYKGACNLGSVFLHNFVEDPFTKNAKLNETILDLAIRGAVRFLDNIIDINKFPHQHYENYQKNMRTIGLGITGLADMLVMLNIKYNSKEGLEYVDNLMNNIAYLAYRASIDLAIEKGSFNFLDKERFVESNFIQKHCKKDERWHGIVELILKYGIRNARILSVAPTGTLSLSYGNNCSSGLEPIFCLEYDRKVKIGGQSDEDIQIVKLRDYAYDQWLEIKDNDDCIVKENIFSTAMDMNVEDHLNMLSVIAFHVDSSCSKTINVPTDYPFEDTKNIYMRCWEQGIKGCTIFRPNEIRQGILITDNKDTEEYEDEENKMSKLPWGTTLQSTDDLIGRKRKLITGCGSLHLQAWYDSYTGRLMEIYLNKGSLGGCNSFMNGLSRILSGALRTGMGFDYMIDQLKSCPSCPSYAVRSSKQKDTSKGNCCPSSIANALIEIQKEIDYEINPDDEEYISNTTVNAEIKSNGCPECGEELQNISGCITCVSCGWSKCG